MVLLEVLFSSKWSYSFKSDSWFSTNSFGCVKTVSRLKKVYLKGSLKGTFFLSDKTPYFSCLFNQTLSYVYYYLIFFVRPFLCIKSLSLQNTLFLSSATTLFTSVLILNKCFPSLSNTFLLLRAFSLGSTLIFESQLFVLIRLFILGILSGASNGGGAEHIFLFTYTYLFIYSIIYMCKQSWPSL